MRLLSATSLAAVIGMSVTVSNAETFDTVGVTCVPSSAAIFGAKYDSGFGGPIDVKWKSGATGSFSLHCPIPVNVPNPSHLWSAFRNDTRTCSSTLLSVSYMKMNKNYGTVTTIATASSSDAGVTNDGTYQTHEVTVSDTWDISNYAYYVKVDMSRGCAGLQEFHMATVW